MSPPCIPEGHARLAAFLEGLQQLGWADGRNLRIDYRWGAGDAERSRKYAAELVKLNPDVILASGDPVMALQQATRDVPIVFTIIADPVGAGLVEGLARPGGNSTGFMSYEHGFGAKWLELLKEIAPSVKRVAVLRNADESAGIAQFVGIQGVAPVLGVELNPIGVRDAGEIERAITAFARFPNGGLIVTGERASGDTSRPDHHTGGSAQFTCGLLRSLHRHRRRVDLLRARSGRPAPARSQIRRSHPQGRDTG